MSNPLRPTATPVSRPVSGSGCGGTPAQEKHTSPPSASRLTLTVLILPTTCRDQRTAIRPIVDRTSKLVSRQAPVPNGL